ncbi:MAG: sugar phosphate isomerase/epimerase [Bryobacterales bacterium]|nr:sugar phosphate isomerase/epimerase [Bryobacterales bacterium]
MRFGIHSMLFRETFVEKDLPLLDKCKAMGFDAVEIIPFDPDHFPAGKVKAAAADLGLAINTGYGMPAEYNIISPDPAVRKAGVEFSRKLIDLSNEVGAEVFGGMIYCGWGYLTGRMRTEEEWKWGVENYRQVACYALETRPQMVLGIEPVNRFESHFINTAADAVRFIREIGTPNVKVHLDFFHMIREEDNMVRAAEETGSDIGYVHACENQRGIPGSGMVPWLEMFKALRKAGYDGCVTIESFDPDIEGVAKLCCIWRKLADSPEQLAVEGLRFLKKVYQQAA